MFFHSHFLFVIPFSFLKILLCFHFLRYYDTLTLQLLLNYNYNYNYNWALWSNLISIWDPPGETLGDWAKSYSLLIWHRLVVGLTAAWLPLKLLKFTKSPSIDVTPCVLYTRLFYYIYIYVCVCMCVCVVRVCMCICMYICMSSLLVILLRCMVFFVREISMINVFLFSYSKA